MIKTQLNITDESQEVSPFPAGDHTWQTQDINNTNDPQKSYRLWTTSKTIYYLHGKYNHLNQVDVVFVIVLSILILIYAWEYSYIF